MARKSKELFLTKKMNVRNDLQPKTFTYAEFLMLKNVATIKDVSKMNDPREFEDVLFN